MLRELPVQSKGRVPSPMHEIICPHCSKAFKIDEAGYADILKQVRDGEFEQQLHERLELAERAKCEAHGSFRHQIALACGFWRRHTHNWASLACLA